VADKYNRKLVEPYVDYSVASKQARPFLYELDKIESRARRKFPECSNLYLYYISRGFMRYWRRLQNQHLDELPDVVWGELYFFFNEKLYEIARCRLDMMWMIYEYDETHLFHEDYEEKPFWRSTNTSCKKYNRRKRRV